MSIPGRLSLLLLLAVCAGCRSTGDADHTAAPVWEAPGQSMSAADLLATHGIAATRAASPTNARNDSFQREFGDAAPAPSNSPASTTAQNGVPRRPGTSLVSVREWCASAGLNPPAQTGTEPQGFTVSSPRGLLLLKIGSQVARWNGMDVHLGHPPQLVQDRIYVQTADIRSTLEPLLAPAEPVLSHARTIMLDAGHGGGDSGARSVLGDQEKDYTLDWALRLRPLLEADGWQVHLTRVDDSEVALTNRVLRCDAARADLFLSLHFNSSAPDKAGLETYCLTPAGVPSTLTRGYLDELDLVLPNNSFDAQNLQLAALLHRALLQVNGGRDRGIRRARFPTVLRTQTRPALLIEGGYLSNREEASLIRTPAYRQKLAEAVAAALRPFAQSASGQSTNASQDAVSP